MRIVRWFALAVLVSAFGVLDAKQSFAQSEVIIGDTLLTAPPTPYGYSSNCYLTNRTIANFTSNASSQWLLTSSTVSFAPTKVGVFTVSYNTEDSYGQYDPLNEGQCPPGGLLYSATFNAISDSLARFIQPQTFSYGWNIDMWPNYTKKQWEGSYTILFDNNIAATTELRNFELSNAPPLLGVAASVHGVSANTYTAQAFEPRTPVTLLFTYPGTPFADSIIFNTSMTITMTRNGKDSLCSFQPFLKLHPYSTTGAVSSKLQSVHALSTYPNPIASKATIDFHLDAYSHVALQVFDALGSEVATLMNGEFPTGDYSQTFDGTRLPDGSYVLQLSANGTTVSRRIVLLKN